MPLTIEMKESGGYDLHEADEWFEGLLVAIEETDGQWGPGLKWIIELEDDEPNDDGTARETWAFCSQKLSPRSKLYAWVKAIDPGSLPEAGGFLDLEEFIGRRVEVMFEHYQGDIDGEPVEKEKVVKIRTTKKARKRVTRAKATDDEPEEDPY